MHFSVYKTGYYHLTFRYKLYSSGYKEKGENAKAIVTIDHEIVGDQPIAIIEGKHGYHPISTGWKTFSGHVYLKVGKKHTIILGAFASHKTTKKEHWWAVYDNVCLEPKH